MNDSKTRDRPAASYDGDFYAWSQDQAARLRDLQPNSIDWENIAEEVEGLGASEKRQIRSRLIVLLLHLLKWHFEPEQRKHGWRVTISYQRYMIASMLRESPSLRGFPEEALEDVFEAARMRAADETELAAATFPVSCPYLLSKIMDRAFFPGPADPDVR